MIRIVGRLINLLPLSLALRLARPVGIFLFWFLKRSRRIALENLRHAYGSEKSEAEIKKVAQESFVHLAEFGIEWLRMPEIAKNPERYLGIEHVERIHDALKNKKRGALLFVSHNGNWEIMALIAGQLIAKPVGAAMYALARPLKNLYVYQEVIRRRGLTGLMSISKIGAVSETFDRLKENGIVSMLVDQRVSEGSVLATFFGRKALTTGLPALAARRLGTPVFFVFLRRTPGLRYIMGVEGPFPVETSKNPQRDVEVNTQRFNDRIEAEIRKNPAHWLWMHNRWRLASEPKDR